MRINEKPDHAVNAVHNVPAGVCTLPGRLGDSTVYIATPVTGVRNLEQVLVLFKQLGWCPETIKHFVVVDYRLVGANTYHSCVLPCFCRKTEESDAPRLWSFSSPAVEWRPPVSEPSGLFHPPPCWPPVRSQTSSVQAIETHPTFKNHWTLIFCEATQILTTRASHEQTESKQISIKYYIF